MRHYGLDAGFTLFILPASKFQHFFFSKEHFKETTKSVRCPVENTAYATCSLSFSFYLALADE